MTGQEQPRNRAYERAISVLQDVAQPEGLPMAERIALAQVWATLANAHATMVAADHMQRVCGELEKFALTLGSLANMVEFMSGECGVLGVVSELGQLRQQVEQLRFR